ncbi:MAG: hypothetical protein EZS28_015770 [Streblomastix strix]|uniref:Uncharacterized protein n=1 Tax=Streblomastix strix TaxID=222440 RepID=A0A5J4W1I0_9EUKA|nr:MAG: hypothetical protein EZS28_015770 [Streblomastix strix]
MGIIFYPTSQSSIALPISDPYLYSFKSIYDKQFPPIFYRIYQPLIHPASWTAQKTFIIDLFIAFFSLPPLLLNLLSMDAFVFTLLDPTESSVENLDVFIRINESSVGRRDEK